MSLVVCLTRLRCRGGIGRVAGLFKGVIPRIGLGIWQTTFMVTVANLIRTRYGQ